MRLAQTIVHDAAVVVDHNMPSGDPSPPKHKYLREIARHHAGKSGYTRQEEAFFVATVAYLYHYASEGDAHHG